MGLVGKYDLQDAYKSIRESLSLAGIYNHVKVKIEFINSENITEENVEAKLKDVAGILVCPGFGQRGIEGKIIAVEYARTHNMPAFGICLGMQMMVIEFARNVLKYRDANSAEMDPATPHNVIDLMEEQKSVTNMGGTMRLGAYDCELREGSRVAEIYGTVGTNPGNDLVEIVEIPGHRWFIGTQFHPEYSSTVLHPHPLFMSFVREVATSCQ